MMISSAIPLVRVCEAESHWQGARREWVALFEAPRRKGTWQQHIHHDQRVRRDQSEGTRAKEVVNQQKVTFGET